MKLDSSKWTIALTALGMLATVPAFVSPAAGIETGQMLDKGPRWPHKSATATEGDKIRVCMPSKSTSKMKCSNVNATELAAIPGLKAKKVETGEPGCWLLDQSHHWAWKAPCPL